MKARREGSSGSVPENWTRFKRLSSTWQGMARATQQHAERRSTQHVARRIRRTTNLDPSQICILHVAPRPSVACLLRHATTFTAWEARKCWVQVAQLAQACQVASVPTLPQEVLQVRYLPARLLLRCLSLSLRLASTNPRGILVRAFRSPSQSGLP